MKNTLILFLTLLINLKVLAAPAPIASKHFIDLEEFSGQSFLQAMLAPEKGIIAHFDSEYVQEHEFLTGEAISYAIDNFDRKNKNRILRMFNFSRRKLHYFANVLKREEKTFTPANINDKVGRILRKLRIRADKYALAQFIAIASKAGTLIEIDEQNYYYNFGYYAPEVRSGRSYGATELHNANDASHLMYLRELEKFLKHENDYRLFYTAMMKFLVDTDITVYQNPEFNKYGKAVLTDYITVYTAELRRHIMKNLHPRRAPWGNDMTEATFLSFFNVKSQMMLLEEGFVKASIKNHWALSKTGSGRSGFGILRRERRTLQTLISKYYRKHQDEAKREIALRVDRLIGETYHGDLYRGVMEFLNNSKNLTDATIVENVDDELTPAFVDFLMSVNADMEEILVYLNSKISQN